jgi:hypothetical protein
MMRPLHYGTLEPPLKQMAHEAETPVVGMDVGPQQPSHTVGQLPRLRELQEEVEVVTHEAIVIKTQAEAI